MTKVLVIGGGIGGLATSIALRRAGVDAVVFEQAKELREIGAGLSVWTNGVKALDAMGIGNAVRSITSPLDLIETRNTKGRILNTVPLEKVHVRLGAPSVGIHRRELLTTLEEALPREHIRTGARLYAVEQSSDCVIAHFEDGRKEEGDALVGADGIFSTVRAEAVSPSIPEYGGYVVWRGVATSSLPDNWPRRASVRTISRDRHFGIVQLTQDRYFWYATHNESRDAPEPGGRKATLLRHFGTWHEPIPQLLEATPEQDMLRHGLYRMAPLRRWSDRLVTLLGDAAHPMAPSLGQGACQALEDAVVLGHEFKSGSAVNAISSYEKKRKPRAKSIVRWSRLIAASEQFRNPLLVAVHDLQTRFTPQAVGVQLFRHFLTFEPPSDRG